MKNNITFIAEIGSNCGDQDIEVAKSYIKASAEAGATVVKFQTLTKKSLFAEKINRAGKQISNPIWDLISNCGLPESWHAPLLDYATECGVEFMATPFYLDAVDLMEKIGVKRYKIASGDITFWPLLDKIGATGKPVILSTGGSSLADVSAATEQLKKAGSTDITLLHCVVAYPPQWEEMNLKAITTLNEAFNCPVGLSDHSPGSVAPIIATTLGTSVIEKHVTFDRSLEGPDHPYAMTFPEFSQMVIDVNHTLDSLGTGEKEPSPDELARQNNYRRGAYDPQTGLPSDAEDALWLRPRHS